MSTKRREVHFCYDLSVGGPLKVYVPICGRRVTDKTKVTTDPAKGTCALCKRALKARLAKTKGEK